MKLLTTITLLCFSVAANAEVYVCSVLNQLSTITRTESGFSVATRFNGSEDLPAQDLGSTNYEIFSERNDQLVLITPSAFSGIVVIIIDKETGKYIEDAIEPPSSGIEWTETEGDCVTIND